MIDRTQMTLQGSVLIVPGEYTELITFATISGFKQFSMADDDGWKLSAPLSDKQKVAYTWLFHKTKGLEKPPEPPKPPFGPKPPTGGSPAAGQRYVEPELLMAVA